MLQHVAAVAAEFRWLSDQKMPETTKRAMQENLSVTAQLQQLSDKTKELLKENDDLRAREKQLKIENAITEPLLHEITKKNVANQKVASLYVYTFMHLLKQSFFFAVWKHVHCWEQKWNTTLSHDSFSR